MIIERNIGRFLILADESVLSALNKINSNKHGFAVAISERGEIMGMLTDGDLRRWLAQSEEINLDAPLSQVINPKILSLPEGTSIEEIRDNLSDKIRAIPLVDKSGRITSIALPGTEELIIGNKYIGRGQPTYIIAEIGNNHNGDMDLGRRLIELAAQTGADCAKFQMRDISTLYGTAANTATDSQDLGAQYTMDLLARFNLSREQLFELFDHCKLHGLEPMCTPWDLPSLEALEEYGLKAYKVASADLTNHELLTALAKTGKPLICSTGMSRESEIRESVSLMRNAGAPFALLHCNSTYPAPYKDINLKYMQRLEKIENCTVGYSGHERGWSIAVAAVALGASIIEKHFTIDRNMEGNDHRVSLLPTEFSDMVSSIRNVEEAMTGDSETRRLTQGEMMNREVLAKSIYATCNIKKGEPITEKMMVVRSPGQGLQPNKKNSLIGKVATRDIEKETPFFESDIKNDRSQPRHFKFSRPWGIPVRWHDWKKMSSVSNLDLLEYHLSYMDIEVNLSQWFDRTADLDLVVHAPELFKGDHILNLASSDPDYRAHSVNELQRVIDITRELKAWHTRAKTPLIITNVGGFSTEAFLPKSQRQELYDLASKSFEELDTEGVELIPQTMPPFPWHFGGQSHHNIFVDPEEIVQFCKNLNARVCLDVSHSQLACNYFHWSMTDFIAAVGPYTAHLHIVDASGTDGEGLQIGEGDIDFSGLCQKLNEVCPSASFVPEIWQGHKNDGAGFWHALDCLEKWL